MKLSFLNRTDELSRLKRAFAHRQGTFVCVYGRRRCGKSRLLNEAMPPRRSVYYVADEREAPLQRTALAVACEAAIPGFSNVTYPDWESLLDRWWHEAPDRSVLALDEFPYLVKASAELPSLLQKQIDRSASRARHLVLCGSSQRMMHGLILDANAPLYGRAREILRLQPLGAGWVSRAINLPTASDALEGYAVWGGVPRYWELAAEYQDTWSAARDLVLQPMGVLHDEPNRLLLDDVRDTAQAASILSLIGAGCHRISEIAGRLNKPATSLTRPLARLMDLGYVRRTIPFGESARSSKKTHYQIADPLLAFWFRYVQPNRSRLASPAHKHVVAEIRRQLPGHIANVWEVLARDAVPGLHLRDSHWDIAKRWWGTGTKRKPLECDLVAESVDRKTLLVGEIKLHLSHARQKRVEQELRAKAEQLPFVSNYETLVLALFTDNPNQTSSALEYVSVDDVLRALT